ncbi:MAG: insulinase family protein [Prevotellaceae bacterium]|nr:insulinase family protein [Prevotella sp.]MDD7256728.1 insulinase family protein [Prevotellaceae bacterium]MDY6130764.1 insulinase family protein [Prevotella sp.]
MKMKRFFVAAAMLFVSTVAMVAQEMQMPPIPVDKSVRIGKLSNGLTYYIRHNGFPEKVANFYIAQRVGSINENDDQRGLAHFLEHMAFNGSDHFKGNGLIEFTRSLGVEFGSDLNAYTGIDQTVYRICNVPTKRPSALDSCLLVLKDWSNGLSIEADEIEKERDVIHNEWRLGEGPGQRMINRALPKMYPGSKYGERLPIGLMSIVDSFKPNTLRAYYKKWYRPDNQAIIVVGDIDVDHMEAEIKRLFGSIKLDPNAPKVIAEKVPDNNEAIYIFEKDKEMTMNQILVFMKHEPTPESEKTSMNYLIESYVKSVISNMLNARLSEMTQDENCPFFQAMAEDGQYMLSKTKDAFQLVGIPKEGKDLETLAALIREAKRACEFGFTATEYERAKADYLSGLEKQYTNRNKIKNDVYGDDYRDHFLANEPIPSIEDLYQTMNMIVPNIPVQAINMAVPELISATDTNLVVLEMAQEKDGVVYPTEATMKQTVDKARAEQLTAYVDNVKDEPLMTQMPQKGKIKKETENKKFGYKELTLSNGATVILKKTDFKDDEIQMQAFSKGGESLYGPADYTNLKVFNNVIGLSGIGNFSSNELQKALAGKNCNVDLSLSKTRQYATGVTTPKDLETMMQMLHLYFTNIKKDEKQFQNLMTQLDMALKNKSLSPESVFGDSVANTIYKHNPRYTNLEIKDLKDINYDRILQIAKERYQNAGQFTFVFAGNFDEAVIRPLIEQYIASLPSTKTKPEDFKDVRTLATGKIQNKFTIKTESPKCIALENWMAKAPYTLENSIKIDVVGQLLSMVYLKTIREEESAAYSVGASGSFDRSGRDAIMRVQAYCPMNPDKVDLAVKLLHQGMAETAKKVDADMLNKVKEYMLKQDDVNAKRNGHWINIITTHKEDGIDMESDYKKIVSGLTPESIQAFMQNMLLSSGNLVEIIMLPQQ